MSNAEAWAAWWNSDEDTPEHSEELNHLIHEDRAEKKGLRWNREKYRYETALGAPVKFIIGGAWVIISEIAWEEMQRGGRQK